MGQVVDDVGVGFGGLVNNESQKFPMAWGTHSRDDGVVLEGGQPGNKKRLNLSTDLPGQSGRWRDIS